ncbi:TetR/AcrR family transcriptional regulator C-terminal domain-containing protein [Kibdelosporangium lantanae]
MSRSELPIWARPEPSGRRPSLSRQLIAATGLRIVDEEGFDALSMRHVAAALGTGAMTLYNYVRTKDELLALMHDELMAQSLVPDLPTHWREALTAVARRSREVLIRHPWAMTALQEVPFGPNAMRHHEQSLAALADTWLDNTTKFELLALVDDYVTGNVLRAAESRKRRDIDPASVAAVVEFGMALLRTGEFPHTAALLGDNTDLTTLPEDTPGPTLDDEGMAAQFERGLAALLDGADARFGITRR